MPARINDIGVIAALSLKLKNIPLGQLSALAIFLNSTVAAGQSEQHAWLGTTPSMREWIGKRLIQQPLAFDYAIKNRKFEVSGIMPLDLLNNDRTAEANEWLAGLVNAVPLKQDELIAELINNSETALGFDGQAFFSNTHQYGQSATFANQITSGAATPAAATAAEAAAAINKAIEALRVLPDDQGRLIANRGMTAVDVIVQGGTVNAAAIRQAIKAERINTGAGVIDNPIMAQDVQIRLVADGLVNLTNTKFIVARSRVLGDAGARPFVFQENTSERRIDVLTEDKSPQFVVENDGVGTFIKMVGNAGYGHFAHAIKSTFV